MTPVDHEVIMSLAEVPGNGAKGSPEDVLRHFGATDGAALGLFLLDKAVEQQDSLDVEMALIVCYVFGFTPSHLDPLLRLCNADWHISHEDVVTALGKLRTPQAVEALYQATQRVPEYLEFDDSRALAVKAIWAMGGTPGAEAEQALTRLLGSDVEILREQAAAQLERRKRL